VSLQVAKTEDGDGEGGCMEEARMQAKKDTFLNTSIRNTSIKNTCTGRENSKWSDEALKALTNEKRGGLTVVSFNRSRFKLFSRKFSNKLVQAPSCDRPRTA
jgi:hypothetical protein